MDQGVATEDLSQLENRVRSFVPSDCYQDGGQCIATMLIMSDADSRQETHAGARHFCELVSTRLDPQKRRNVLVAGCGSGHEALHIRKDLGVPVTGVDIVPNWESLYGAEIDNFDLLIGSILDLPFDDDTFDIVFYHHVIEHVIDPAKSLDELLRVLVPGGLIYVGTPNRHRAVGYIGSPDATTSEKIKWNLLDYRARLKGKFRNEYGAHAGFSQEELGQLLSERFMSVDCLTSDYLHFKYKSRLPRAILNLICRRPLIEVIAPSVYAAASKRPGGR